MIVQIYETQDAAEAARLAEAGVDHIGVLVGHGDFPREIPPERARGIVAAAGSARTVALTLSADLDEIARVVEATDPDILHLGMPLEDVAPGDVQILKKQFPGVGIMRTIPVTDEGSVALAMTYEGIADYLLLDTQIQGQQAIGATGRTHDWNLSRRIVEAVGIPVVLAGGLGPDNVVEAIGAVRPFGVDSKTRTDHDGGPFKDLEKVAAFAQSAKAAG